MFLGDVLDFLFGLVFLVVVGVLRLFIYDKPRDVEVVIFVLSTELLYGSRQKR